MSDRSIRFPLTVTVGVPNWPAGLRRAGALAAASVSAPTAAAFGLFRTQAPKSPVAFSSVPKAISSSSVRPAEPSAGWELNSFAWYFGKIPAGTAHRAALAARVE